MKKYVPRRDLARALGILPSTIGAWDAHHKGVGKPIYVTSRFVVYAESDVREFFRARGEYDEVWVTPRERQKQAAARAGATPSPRGHGAGTRSRADARSGVLEATSAVVGGHEDEDAPPVVADVEEP